MEKCSKDIASKLIESQASELKDLSEKVDRLYKLLGVYVEKNNLLESGIYDDSMLHGKSTIRGFQYILCYGSTHMKSLKISYGY